MRDLVHDGVTRRRASLQCRAKLICWDAVVTSVEDADKLGIIMSSALGVDRLMAVAVLSMDQPLRGRKVRSRNPWWCFSWACKSPKRNVQRSKRQLDYTELENEDGIYMQARKIRAAVLCTLAQWYSSVDAVGHATERDIVRRRCQLMTWPAAVTASSDSSSVSLSVCDALSTSNSASLWAVVPTLWLTAIKETAVVSVLAVVEPQ